MRKLYCIISVLGLAFLLSCNRDDEITKTRINIDEGDIEFLFRSSFSGTIIDANGEPIGGVNISVNGEDHYSNEDGIFSITNTLLNDTGEVVIFSKTGYFNQFEKIVPKVNSFNSLFIKMHDKSGAKTIKSDENSSILFADGNITFSSNKNNLITPNAAPYNGNANIYVKSSADPFFPVLPNSGNQDYFQGISTNVSEENIFPINSFLIQCESANGSELLFKDSVTIKLSKDLIPVSDQNITLWYYDEKNGNWTVTKSKYVDFSSEPIIFNIKNQGYYLLSPAYTGLVEITGQVTYNDGSPARFIDLLIDDKKTSFVTFAFTDENGNYFVQMPKGSDLTITGMNCGELGNELSLGIVNSDKIFDFIIEGSPLFFHLYGILNNEGMMANKAFAGISSGFGMSEYHKISNDSMGTSIPVSKCLSTMFLYDLDDLPIVRQSSGFDASDPFVNIANYPAVFETQSYIFVYDNQDKIELFDAQPVFFNENGIYYISNNGFKSSIFIKFAKTGQDKYEGDIAYLEFINSEFQIFESDTSGALVFEIFNDNSSEISGSFTGTLTIDNIKTNVNGYFKIQK
jgi:hypothetical protein